MDILILLIFISAMLVVLAVLSFAWTLRSKTFDHVDRLALMPLDDAPRSKRSLQADEANSSEAE